VSQRQKQRTNENRARRLGTGEGISRDGRKPVGGGGGVPSWAWVVAGAVLIAAIAIVAAIVFTRGDSSGSGGTPSVVQDRLSNDKVDFAVEGTWQPNYDNLAGAISALNLPPAGNTTHYHSHITMYVDGQKVLIPQNIGIDEVTQTLSPIHTHDTKGVIHIESDTADFTSNLQNVFDIWGVRFDSQCIGGYCDGVKMWVNGKPNDQLGDYVMNPHDAITIVEGAPPPGFKPDQSYKFPAGE
jgi:hypothetical protein